METAKQQLDIKTDCAENVEAKCLKSLPLISNPANLYINTSHAKN